jgi:hypothetical protein
VSPHLDKELLEKSSRRWLQAALEALGRGESLDFAVHHTGVGLEARPGNPVFWIGHWPQLVNPGVEGHSV